MDLSMVWFLFHGYDSSFEFSTPLALSPVNADHSSSPLSRFYHDHKKISASG
jgi:hypothetical protein